jgi:hypothetical protein
VLAAIGNHEGKALTFLSMEPDTAYGVSALHRRFLEIQGNTPSFKGTVNLQQKYCIHSFEPVGLVARAVSEGGFLRHVTDDPDGRASALAGHLLAVTEHCPFSLTQLFGRTSTAGVERAPAGRLEVLRVLLATDGTSTQAEISRRTGVAPGRLTDALASLARTGLVEYRSDTTYQLKSRYLVHDAVGHVVGRGGGATFQNAVADALNARRDAAGGSAVVLRDDIEDDLLAQPQFRERYVRDHLQRVMVRLTDRKQVVSLQDFRRQVVHSATQLDVAQRPLVRELVDGIEAIAHGDDDAVERSRARARVLLASPERVRALLLRGFGANKVLNNPVSAAQKELLVLTALEASDGATTSELVEVLEPSLNRALVGGTLSALARQGRVHGVTQVRGPHKRWYLGPADDPSPEPRHS